jgi:hypothetical protein
MHGRSIGPTVETTGWVSRTMARPMRRADDGAVYVAVAVSGLKRVTEFDSRLLQLVGLVPSDENRLLVHDSVAGGMYFGCGDEPAALRATEDDSHLLITSGNGARAMGSTKSIRITNSARTAIVAGPPVLSTWSGEVLSLLIYDVGLTLVHC